MEPMETASTIERMLLDQAKRTRTPANGSIELLPLCNMNCDIWADARRRWSGWQAERTSAGSGGR